MEKFLLSLLCLLTVGFAGQAETWTTSGSNVTDYDSKLEGSSKDTKKAPTKWTDTSANLMAVWDMSYVWQTANSVYYSRSKNGIQLGSGSSGIKELTLKTTDIPGEITKVTILGAKSNGSAKLSVVVAGVSYKTNNEDSYTANGTAADVTFAGNQTGEITIKFYDNADGKYVALAGITVEYQQDSDLVANGLAYPQDAYTATLGEAFESPVLTNPNNLAVTYSSSNEDVATIDVEGNVTLVAAGTTVIKADFVGDETYKAGSAEYVLTVNKASVVVPQPGENSFLIEFVSGNNPNGIELNKDVAVDIYVKTGKEYLVGISGNTSRVWYNVAQGIRIGASSNTGNVTFELNKEYSITSVVAYCELYSASDKKAGININNISNVANGDGEVEFIMSDNIKTNLLSISTEKATGVKPRIYIKYIVVNYAPAAPAVPEIVCEHEIVDGKLTVNAESTTLNFKKIEGIDIYYRLNGGKDKPATRACEDVAHSSWILHQGEDITLTNNHTLLEYLACNPETGVHSETKTIALEVGPTGVAEIEAAEAGEVRWFDMQGREVKGQPAAGVYVRVANGKATKVVVK